MAGCVASACKSGHRGASDPVVRDTAEGLGPGIGPAALCRRPLPTMSRPCAIILRWARPYKGRRISGFVQAIFGGFLSISPRSQKTSVFWGVPIVDSIPGITCIIRILGGHDADDAGDAGDVVPEVGPTLPKTCNFLKS